MLDHIVLIRPRPDVHLTAVTALWAELGGLASRVPGIVGLAVGENVSSEGKDRGYTLGFVMTFESRTALEAYLPHPDHVAVVPLVQAVAEDVLVFDLERR